MTRKRSRRRTRYGLSKQHTRHDSREFVDFDYIDKLDNPDDLNFLDKFSREYYQDSFRNDGSDITSEPGSDERREAHTARNARRRDMWSRFARMPYDYTDSTVFDDPDDEKKK